MEMAAKETETLNQSGHSFMLNIGRCKYVGGVSGDESTCDPCLYFFVTTPRCPKNDAPLNNLDGTNVYMIFVLEPKKRKTRNSYAERKKLGWLCIHQSNGSRLIDPGILSKSISINTDLFSTVPVKDTRIWISI